MWTIKGNKNTSGTYTLEDNDNIWWTAGADNTSTNYVTVTEYNTGTHIYANDQTTHQAAIQNTKYVDENSVSVNSASAKAVSSLTTNDCGLQFIFDTTDLDNVTVALSDAKLYAFDGQVDINPMGGVVFQATGFAGSTPTGSEWVEANGLNNALSFPDQNPATTFTFYVATSMSPTSTGSKEGQIKFSLNFS